MKYNFFIPSLDLRGDEKLFSYSERVDPSELIGECKVLSSPIIEEGFKRILSKYTNTGKEVAFFSLCTASRPYSTSLKWKWFKKDFTSFFDPSKFELIVCSNGGIIPEPFWNSYPYLSYDAHGEPQFLEQYRNLLYSRLKSFLSTVRFRFVIADFRSTQRNRQVFEILLPELKKENIIQDYRILPSDLVGKKLAEDFNFNCKAVNIVDGGVYKLPPLVYPSFHPLLYNETLTAFSDFLSTPIDISKSHVFSLLKVKERNSKPDFGFNLFGEKENGKK